MYPCSAAFKPGSNHPKKMMKLGKRTLKTKASPHPAKVELGILCPQPVTKIVSTRSRYVTAGNRPVSPLSEMPTIWTWPRGACLVIRSAMRTQVSCGLKGMGWDEEVEKP